jgi:hypothetical protein
MVHLDIFCLNFWDSHYTTYCGTYGALLCLLATKVGNLIGANEKEDTQEIIS